MLFQSQCSEYIENAGIFSRLHCILPYHLNTLIIYKEKGNVSVHLGTFKRWQYLQKNKYTSGIKCPASIFRICFQNLEMVNIKTDLYTVL